ncbi:two-component regulator propeller domain-containing protein [Paraflavisolibacter sp. H34]|uniref:hybrid sensor histidine kinase/response regulator transcription factor n=1 Tax=Huijunlia imazamoxiresistens TaxID=3127457 RepID=UPI00301792FA
MKSKGQRVFSFILVLFLLISPVSAQPRGKIEHYTTGDGLSHQRVTAMIKDREGFMWFGTWDGINRFDGHTFVSYKSAPSDKYQLRSNRIDRIVEDQSGHLWILAADRQVYRFDKKRHQFLPLSTIIRLPDRPKIAFSNILLASGGLVWLQSDSEGIFCVSQTVLSEKKVYRYAKGAPAAYRLPSNDVNFLFEDKEHRIWIGTPAGLSCLEKSPEGIYTNNPVVPAAITGLHLTKFAEDAGHLYFGTTNGNLIVCEKKTKTFTVHPIAAGRINALLISRKKPVLYACSSLGEVITVNLIHQQWTTARYQPVDSLSAPYEDQSGALWLRPQQQGAIRFDPGNNSFQLFQAKAPAKHNSSNRFYKVVEDYNGTVWVFMNGGGFGYYHPATKGLEQVIATTDEGHHPFPGDVQHMYYDQAGVFWLRTGKPGLLKIILQDNDFRQQPVLAGGPDQPVHDLKGIYADRKGRLWLGARNGPLFIYQNGVPLKGVLVNEPPGGVVGVYSILQDSRGNMWLGTKGNGLFKAVPVDKEATKYRLLHFLPGQQQPEGLPCHQIYALLEDRQGRVWIGSMDSGLVLVEDSPTATGFVPGRLLLKNYPKASFQSIRHMALDKEGNIWIGTTDGLVVLGANDPHAPTYHCKLYSTVPGDKESLGNNDIQFIQRDRKGRMWLATAGGGFCQAIGSHPFRSLRFRKYTTRDGLANDYILSCAEDAQGSLWLATENGLSRFHPETGVFRNYDAYDGLPMVTFSEASVTLSASGQQFYWGTANGYLSFDPQRLRNIRIPGNIAFTQLYINNEEAGPGANETALHYDINYISELTLKHHQNIVSIAYAIPDARAGRRQAFAYRLVGFDSAWHDDRQFRRATYTNLPPGQYVFEVKSLSPDLYSNQPYKRLSITILPPWWKTWWAWLLYALLAGALLYLVWRYATVLIRLRNKIAVEQKMAALKMDFFTNVSHELRTPLTLIVNPLEQLSAKGGLSSEQASWVDVARKNAARMVRFVNQLLDLRKVQSEKAELRLSRVELVSFARSVSDHFREAARVRQIQLDVLSDQQELFAWVDAEKLDVVLYNLLGNALKFTPEGKAIHIRIQFLAGEDSFSLAVEDQGPGVPNEKLEEIFELFQEGDPAHGGGWKGTGIGLALSRELVRLHGATIRAENNREGGLTVTVRMKLGSESYGQWDGSVADRAETAALPEQPAEQPAVPSASSKGAPQGGAGPVVLLVEDNEELRSFIQGQLSAYYQVETAKDGQEGLQKAIALLPDLIVSDIMMPRMDGIRMLDQIKNEVSTSHIPVVLLSARYSVESRMEGLRYGADCYITKPFPNELLLASVENLLRQRKRLFETLVEKKTPVSLSPEPVVMTSRDESFLKDVIQVVEDKMADTDFNIESIAVEMAMSRSTFYKKFKSLTGLTPVEFVRDLRLQRARQFFDAGAGNVSEVAYGVGFSNPGYFTTCFKEKYNVLPSDYVRAKKT